MSYEKQFIKIDLYYYALTALSVLFKYLVYNFKLCIRSFIFGFFYAINTHKKDKLQGNLKIIDYV